jgi:hypothetical protein
MKVWPIISESDAAAVAAFAIDSARRFMERKAEARFRARLPDLTGDRRANSMDAMIGRAALKEANARAAKVRAYANALIAYRAGAK